MDSYLRTKTTSFKGNQVAYRSGKNGAGAALIFIHGAGGDSRFYHFQMREFSGDRRIIVPDLPSHGRSQCDYLPTLQDYAGCIETICEEEGIVEIIPAGHSMGGAVALELFRRGIVSIRAFIFISTGALLPVSRDIFDFVSNDYKSFVEFIIRFTYGKNALPEMKETSRKELEAMDPAVIENDFRICAGADGRDLLKRVTVPTLIIASESDKMVPPGIVGELHAGITGSHMLVLPGDSHVPHLMSHERVNVEIKTFISGIS